MSTLFILVITMLAPGSCWHCSHCLRQKQDIWKMEESMFYSCKVELVLIRTCHCSCCGDVVLGEGGFQILKAVYHFELYFVDVDICFATANGFAHQFWSLFCVQTMSVCWWGFVVPCCCLLSDQCHLQRVCCKRWKQQWDGCGRFHLWCSPRC